MTQRGYDVLAAAIAALLVAAGLVGLGAALSGGLQKFKATERTVDVKGLAEREVPANLAIWGIQHADADNDLPALYARFETKNAAIQAFLFRGTGRCRGGRWRARAGWLLPRR